MRDAIHRIEALERSLGIRDGAGCAQCSNWPRARYTDEPLICAQCGRQWHGLTRIFHFVPDPRVSDPPVAASLNG